MNVVALCTGRAGSSLPGKNIIPILNKPCAQWGMEAASGLSQLSAAFCSSDSPELLELGSALGYQPIERPSELASDTAKHEGVLLHALESVPVSITADADALLVLMANAPVITTAWIEEALAVLESDPRLTSVIPVAEDNDKHPVRARRVSEDGVLTSYLELPTGASSTRQELPTAFFALHNFWLIRLFDGELRLGNHAPWPAWGDRPAPIYSNERFCDIHEPSDIPIVEAALVRVLSGR